MQFKKYLIPVLLLALTACGGGGSAAPAPAPTPMGQANNDTASVDEDSAVSIDVLANDTLINSASLAISVQPANGSAELNETNIDYTPDADFNGSDSITYTVNNTAGTSVSATVTITVNDINDAPIASADSFVVLDNTPTDLTILANDSDADGSVVSASVIEQPANGSVTVSESTITYTPDTDFSGDDSFTYAALDDNADSSNTVTVSINVDPTLTTLAVTSLTIPDTGYTQLNNAELGEMVLTSADQTLTIPNRTVSFSLMLQGDDVSLEGDNLFINSLTNPDGDVLSPNYPDVTFCDVGLCGAVVPRKPEVTAENGNWQFNLGTLSSTLDSIDMSGMTLQAAVRTGPEPDLGETFPAVLNIKPFLTTTTIDLDELTLVLDQFTQLANDNNIGISIDPITIVEDTRFVEVSSDFTDEDTADLVTMGDADKINVFFIESFSGPDGDGIVGISGGLPGTMGIKSPFNGILIDANKTRVSTDDFYADTTSHFVLHEIGHFLGLYHTTEQQFDEHDVLADTSECLEAVHDDDNNGIADVKECPDGLNIMFWNTDLLATKDPFSDDQKEVIYYSPIAVP